MTRATLADVLQPALRGGYAVAGLVCLGWEDARAYVVAAEEENCPVILLIGPGCRAHTPLHVLGAMYGHLAERSQVPVVTLLDHGASAEECRAALEAGFTSVMYDGSALPFAENAARTAAIAEMAHDLGASCEGEIGFVGYAEGAASTGTDPDEAAEFAARTGVDALAVSVGNTHLSPDQSRPVNTEKLAQIAEQTDVPLVIHGGSGVPAYQRQNLARHTPVCKFNIGTELRQVFGQALRQKLAADPENFDRIDILSATHDPLVSAARKVMRNLGPAR
ncbi:fructose-bisphosphate aldolase [Actibacterium mucosum KCTC 23349]|uniref:Fructose-bisphosphate aldolase n=1 Tax=Actibacterium mucosum KCTC 23349 TaxID=1454373 RepID=A0A037ZHL2_9RHOB|nr:class II fructose-bisphosphate aldolase [Actibacterium mucosum]KAJ55895.1 fructose-bisphosphate aldolase [Actibacterium mucosum KCTC 23349]